MSYFPPYGTHKNCTHGGEGGCMWCCPRCDQDRHHCPACGEITDHYNTPCPEHDEPEPEPCPDCRPSWRCQHHHLP